MPFDDFVTADTSARFSEIENFVFLDVENHRTSDVLRMLLLGLYSPNKKLIKKVIELIGKVKETSELFKTVIPTLIDFMGTQADSDIHQELQMFFSCFLRKASFPEKTKTLKMALNHPLEEVRLRILNAAGMLSVEELGQLDADVLELLQRLQKDPKDRVRMGSTHLLKKLKVKIREKSLKSVKEPKDLNQQAKPSCSQSQARSKVFSKIKTQLKEAFALNGNSEDRRKALEELGNVFQGTNWIEYASYIRKALQDKDQEISAKACEILKGMVKINMEGLEKQIEEFMQPLFRLIDVFTDIVSLKALSTLEEIVVAYRRHSVLINIFYNINSKSETIRRLSAKLTTQALDSWPEEELHRSILSLEEVLRKGIKDTEDGIRAQWRRALLKFSLKFEQRAEVIFIEMEGKVTNIDLQFQSGTEEINGNPDDEICFHESKITHVRKLSQGVSSRVVSGLTLCRRVAVRFMTNSNRIRIEKETQGFNITQRLRNFTPLIGKIQLDEETGFIMPLYDFNLRQFIEVGMKESLKLKALLEVVKGIEQLHALNLTHNSLVPEHVHINVMKDDMEVTIRNFWRLSVDGNKSTIQPSHGWPDEENLMPSFHCTKQSDYCALGMLSFYICSGGKDPINIFKLGYNIQTDLNITKPALGEYLIKSLIGAHNDIQTSIRLFRLHPLFWRKNSFSFFVDRLRECFLRRCVQAKAGDELKWKETVPSGIMTFMETKKGSPYHEGLWEHVNFLRNLSMHGRQSKETSSITGTNNENLESWFESTFQGGLAELFEKARQYFDDQLLDELESIIIK